MPRDLSPWDAGPQPDRGGLLEDKAIALRKAKARTLDALFKATHLAIAAVSEEDARGFFGHCGYGLASTADMKTALFIFTVGWKVGMLNALLGLGREEIREAGSLGSKGKLGCRSLPGRGGGLFIRTI